ncbi:hypothetical protein [Ornithinimicrobium kibberense]
MPTDELVGHHLRSSAPPSAMTGLGLTALSRPPVPVPLDCWGCP